MQTGLRRVEAESIDNEDFLVEMTQWNKEAKREGGSTPSYINVTSTII